MRRGGCARDRAWSRALAALAAWCALAACSPAAQPAADGGGDAAGEVGEAYLALRVVPASARLLVHQRYTFVAELTRADGRPRAALPSELEWSSDAPAVATIDAAGQAAAQTPGTTTITAGAHGLRATAVLEVRGRAFERIEITPAMSTLEVGQHVAFTATTWDAEAHPVDVTSMVTWSSSDPTIARIDSTATLTALAAGTTMVRATIGTVMSNAATVTVREPSVVSIALTPVTATLRPGSHLMCPSGGSSTALRATATLSNGSARDVTELAAWTSSAPMIVSVSNEPGMHGVATASATMAGTANISARYTGVTSSPAVITVLPDSPPQSLMVTALSRTLCVSRETTITATVAYADGRTGDLSAMVSWTSSAPSVAVVDPTTLRLRALAPGSATITASVSNGAVPPCIISGATTVTVPAESFASFVLTPARATIPVSGYQHYTASAVDACGLWRSFDADVTLTSSDATVAVPVADGNVVGTAAGTATVSADTHGLHAEATLEVTAP